MDDIKKENEISEALQGILKENKKEFSKVLH